jgi:hypothetical protein
MTVELCPERTVAFAPAADSRQSRSARIHSLPARASNSHTQLSLEAASAACSAARQSSQVRVSCRHVLSLPVMVRASVGGVGQVRSRQRAQVPGAWVASVQVPAFVEGRTFDVLASNRLAVALSPRLQPGYNRLRSLLLDPEEQAFQQDWTRSTEGFIAAFRKSIGDDIDSPRFVELVGELALSSERFRTLWARHDVRSLDGGTTTVNHPVVGELRLHRDKLPVDDLLLVLYYADQGSESDEKLRLLASMAQAAPTPDGRRITIG